MFQFDYNYKDYGALQKDLEKSTGGILQDGLLRFNGNVFNGFMHRIEMTNGLQAMISDLQNTEDVIFQRNKSKSIFYTLRMEEISAAKNLTLKIGDDLVSVENDNRSAAILTSSLFDFAYQAKKGTRRRSVGMLIDPEWMARYLGIKDKDEVLQKYLALKIANLNLEPFDARYRQLIQEVFVDYSGRPFEKLILQNRIMLLVEYFFTRLYKKMSSARQLPTISNVEIELMMEAEARLVADFTQAPPTISFLAKLCTMSETKFKIAFKKMYGQSPYGYYQLNRMNRARQLLLTKKFSVKEVGRKLGYNNLSNFTIAFKKEFKILPSEIF